MATTDTTGIIHRGNGGERSIARIIHNRTNLADILPNWKILSVNFSLPTVDDRMGRKSTTIIRCRCPRSYEMLKFPAEPPFTKLSPSSYRQMGLDGHLTSSPPSDPAYSANR